MVKTVILDPTKLYPIPEGYIVIKTEYDWIKSFFIEPGQYWVVGTSLCRWSEEWLGVRNQTDAIVEIKLDPKEKLKRWFDPIPEQWGGKKLLELATTLDRYPPETAIAHYLAERTQNDLWNREPSPENLATWLNIEVDPEDRPIEKVWMSQRPKSDLYSYYQTEDKLRLLRRWLNLIEPPIPELETYPFPVPDRLAADFDRHWERELHRTQGEILKTLNTERQPDINRVANLVYRVSENRPEIAKVAERKLTHYLSEQQLREIRDRQPPPEPPPLAADATPEAVLDWVTRHYLPFRRWEASQKSSPPEKIGDRLAEDFVEWILEHYPQLKLTPVENSPLNYSVTHTIENCCQDRPVFWVVVDGLGWLDHWELLSILREKYGLKSETEIQPKFALLPTKTEYAKWGLYAQLTPDASDWKGNCDRAFDKLGRGKRYTDSQTEYLYEDLRQQKYSLYCWDTTQLDKLYHDRGQWHNLYRVKRPHTLEGIAKEIDYCIRQYPRPENLSVAIASDHGQILGISNNLSPCPPGLEPKGRMAIGKTDDPRFAVLDRDRYGLPHDISIVRSSATLNTFNYTQNGNAIGSHGGLFPEEVVVGFSRLRLSATRHPVMVSCRGEGKPRQPGTLKITIRNPNPISIRELRLFINEIPEFTDGHSLLETVPTNGEKTLSLTLSSCPDLPQNRNREQFSLSGYLTFKYTGAECDRASLDPTSHLTVKQMFSSGMESIDDFL